jgi:site-specific DNA recombinase
MCSMTSVALLIRKSTKDEAQVSINRQETLGRAWAEQHHPASPISVYVDDGISGADMTRPGWSAFCSDVRSGRIDHLWAYEQSRLTRAGVATWDDVAVMLTLAGIGEVHTHRQGAISVREGNRLQGRLLAVIDQEERERARVRVLDAHAQLAAEGRPNGTRVYGYRSARDAEGRATRVIVEEEAAIIREIVERMLRGETLMRIANDLQARGVPTAKGGRWQNSVLKSIVSNAAIAGRRALSGGDTVPATWPAILEEQQWLAVRAHLANTSRMVIDRSGKPRRITTPARAGHRWLLTAGIAVCGRCGERLYASANSRPDGKSSYACNKRSGPRACGSVSTLADPLETYVVDKMFEEIEARRRPLPENDGAAVVVAELAEAESRMRVLAEDFAAGLLAEEVYRDALGLAAARASTLREKLTDSQTALGEMADLDTLRSRWKDLTVQRKREVIARIIRQVTLSKARRTAPRVFDETRIQIDFR